MPAHTAPVNLLPKSDFDESGWGRFLHWAVTSGRYIIIATELVVIAAFLSRFKLDQDLAQINDTINGQKTILTRQLPLEEEFRLTQSRLSVVDVMVKSQVQSKQKFEKLLAALPNDIKLQTVSMKATDLTIAAITPSEEAIGEFLGRLKKDAFFKEMEMSEFVAKDGQEITFKLLMRN